MSRLAVLSVASLISGAAAARRIRKHKGDPAWVKLDQWNEIADGIRLQTQADHPDDHETFDWRAWGEEFEAKTFDQQDDHLNAYNQQKKWLDSNSTSFPQRYWINTKAWAGKEARGPIFAIISPYGGFNAYAYGFIGEMAREMGAMVLQLEGRFSPGSLPFGESGFDHAPNRIGLASAENALRDYVMLISHLRDVYDPDWVCPVATFGGSLAGMYAAWLRYKFPHIVDMSFASGSPMTGYPGTSDTLAFTRVITEAWEDASGDPSCVELVRDSFKALEGDSCSEVMWSAVYNEAAYYAYPPRGRIANACQRAAAKRDAGGSPVEVALELCGPTCAGGCPAYEGSPSMWGYVSCTQVVNPIGSDGVSDFFYPPAPWNVENRRASCMETWDIEPQQEGDYHAEIFGFHRLPQLADSMKRMLFSFGSYDPWTGFALSTKDISEDIPVVLVKGGSHCSDFIGSRAEDTADMLEARGREAAALRRWVAEVQRRPTSIA